MIRWIGLYVVNLCMVCTAIAAPISGQGDRTLIDLISASALEYIKQQEPEHHMLRIDRLDYPDHLVHITSDRVEEIIIQSLSTRGQSHKVEGAWVEKDTKHAAAFEVRVTVSDHVEVPVLSKKIQRGQTIQARDVFIKEVDAKQLKEGIALEKEALIGMQAKRGLLMNRPVVLEHLQVPDVIMKKARVTIIYQAKNLELKTPGVALESGGLGQMIRVKNTDTGKEVYAEIIDAQRVRVR